MVYVPSFDDARSGKRAGDRSRWWLGGLALLLAGAAAAATSSSGGTVDPLKLLNSPNPGPGVPPSSPDDLPIDPGVPIDMFTTRSGHWRLNGLTSQGDAAVYRMTLDEKPGFAREIACRPIATKEAGAETVLTLQTVRLLNVEATVAQGACRVVQNMSPVVPHLEWIREAVDAHIIPAYRRDRAWVSGLKPLARGPRRGAYDPKSLGPRTDGTAAAPTAGNNFVGVTSAQGGEYISSRGFLHDADARVVDAALHDERDAVAAYWPEFEQYSFYSLAQPQGAAWSAANHVTIDPQFPQDGERGWELPFRSNPKADVDSVQAVDDWGRDAAHLENTGFIHWLATEDPIAGFVVQRQAAFALAARYEYLRGGYSGTRAPAATTYAGTVEQERGIFNTLSVLWKSLDVSRRVHSVEGRMFWSEARARRQADDVIAFYDQIATRVATAGPEAAADYTAQLSGAPFTTVGVGAFVDSDGEMVKLRQLSAFEAVQYGKDPLWLWSRAGNTTVRRWFTVYATGLAARMAVIGGTMGVDGRKSTTGSGYPSGPTTVANGYVVAASPPFSSTEGWAAWVASLPLATADARDSFDGAAVHTAMQMEGALLMADDAGLSVPALGSALSRIRAARAATTGFRYTTVMMHKHLSAPS